jgi:hypothetical protein
MPWIYYVSPTSYEACQRKKRANSWNGCHSRIGCLDSKSVIKICWDFVRAIFNTSVWLPLAAQIPAEQKSGCPRLPYFVPSGVRARAKSERPAGPLPLAAPCWVGSPSEAREPRGLCRCTGGLVAGGAGGACSKAAYFFLLTGPYFASRARSAETFAPRLRSSHLSH